MDRVKRSRGVPAALAALAAVLACALAVGRADARTPDPQTCLQTAPVDTARYFNTRGGQPWQGVADYMAAAGANFNLGVMDTQPVKLCAKSGDPSCLPKVLQIRSEQRTMCLDSAAFAGRLRIVGMVVGAGPGSLPAYGFGLDNISGGGSDRDSVYLFVRDSTVYALYRTTGNLTAFAPQPGLTPGWSFIFHTPDTPPTGVWALWRPNTSSTASMTAMRAHRGGPAAPGEVEEAQTTLSYAWMACAAGCCQFHGTGDGNPFPDVNHGHHGNPPPPNPNPNPNPHPARRR
jgi:hypothetical protein